MCRKSFHLSVKAFFVLVGFIISEPEIIAIFSNLKFC